MARGTVVNEPVVSQASTEEFRAGYERVFGDRKPVRGRFIYDPEQGKCVPADEYVPPSRAVDGPIMSGRCHENTIAPDGTDISTRAKRKAWMRATGNVDFDDYKNHRAKVAADKASRLERPDKPLRDLIGRELYKRKMIT